MKQPIVFVMVAILMAMPFAGSNAFANEVVLNANLVPVCGLNNITSFPMGTLISGQISDEKLVTISATSDTNARAEIEVQASDWIGTDISATGTLTLTTVSVGAAVTVSGNTYSGVDGEIDGNYQFSIGSDDEATATNLVASMNADDRFTADRWVASASGNIVTITATVAGEPGNNISLSGDTSIQSSSPTLSGGSDGDDLVHLQSDATKYNVTFEGTNPFGELYPDKTAMKINTESAVLGTTTFQNSATVDILMALQVSADGNLENLPYSGGLTQTLTFTTSCNA